MNILAAMNVTRWNPGPPRWYTPPPLLAAYANAGLDGTGRWQLLQWYMLVQGHSGTTTTTSATSANS